MKVLIFEAGKGLASYTSELANNLAELGVDVYYMTSKLNHRQNDLNPKVFKVCILDEYNVCYKSFSLKWIVNRFFVLIKNILRRNLFIRRNNIDVVNIHWTIPLVELFLLKLFVPCRVKYIMTVHNVVPHKRNFFDFGFRFLLKRQDGLIVHTSENVEELKQLFGIKKRVFMIPHGVNPLYKRLEKKTCQNMLNIHTNKQVVLFFGAIKNYKGLEYLIDAVTDLDCFLLIAGHIDGSFEKYAQQIKERKIDCLYKTDFIPEKDVPIYFQSSDIAVLPYAEFHSQSGVLLQIAKYGLPLVATNVGSFEQYAEKYGNALICKRKNSCDLKMKLMELLNSQPLKNKMKLGAEKIVFEHSWNIVAREYSNVFFKQIRGDV